MFSVVIPLFNKEISIQSALNSVLIQTFNDFEVIVIDDGSTDESVVRVKEFDDPRIRIIQKTNGGVSSARNMGIEMAQYDHIAFLDADDLWEPDYLHEQYLLIQDFSGAALWSCAYGHIEGNEKIKVDHALPEGYRDFVSDYFTMNRLTDLFHSSSVVIHKSAFRKAGLFDTRIKYCEDVDMYYRIIVHFPVVFYNKMYVYFRQDAENRAMKRKIQLKYYLPYYIDKYNSDTSIKDHSFLSFINNWSAVKLLYYYFDTKEERAEAREATRKLDYSLIKKKYFMLYKTPPPIGYVIYKLILFKKWIWKNLAIKNQI